MREEWKDKMRQSLADYEESAPAGLWEDIQKTVSSADTVMQSAGQSQPGGNRYKVLALRLAAAAACVAFGAGIYLNVDSGGGDENGVVAEKVIGGKAASNAAAAARLKAVAANETSAVNDVAVSPGKLLAEAIMKRNTDAESSGLSQPSETDTQQQVSDTRTDGASANGNEAETAGKDSKANQGGYGNGAGGNNAYKEAYRTDRHAKPTPHTASVARKVQSGNLTATLFAANAVGGSNKGTMPSGGVLLSQSDAMFSAVPQPDEAANAKTDFFYVRGGADAQTVKHPQPIRVGLSLHYSLSDRWGIETGVTYSYLYSEMTTGQTDNRYETKQKVHFIGIPLTVDYSLWRNRLLNVYVAAGGMVEKSVSAKASTSYVLGNTEMSSQQDKLKMRELQWSVDAAAGIQLNITKEIGVFAEPGVGYYFDNGSAVKTAYSDKPFHFNMKLGLRYSLR